MFKKIFFSPFILTPIITAALGNFSLGLILAGLTTLIWGYQKGALFISICSSLILILTGNINMEIVFLLVLTLAYFVREYKLLNKFEEKTAYFILFLLLLLLTPILRVIFGLIPASLLNEINVASSLLILAGLVLFIIRGRIILYGSIKVRDFFEYIFCFLSAILALMGSIFTIPLWTIFVFALKKNSGLLEKEIQIEEQSNKAIFTTLSLFLILIAIFSAYLIIPMGILSFSIIIIFGAYLLRNFNQVPLVELVYLSMILGVIAGKVGFLL
ncbi:MAG: hypothetical protein ACOCQO_01175 [Halanaerobiaceae bacterium]